MKRHIAYLSFALLLSACTDKPSDVLPNIDLDAIFDTQETPEFRWNDIAESVDVIKLHNADNSPVGTLFVHQMLPDGSFVMRDIQTVGYLADRNGEINFSLNRSGRGPEEYVAMANIRRNGDVIYVQDGVQNKILLYKTDGSFVRAMALDGNYQTMDVLPDGNIITFRNPIDAMDKKVDYVNIFNTEGEKIAGFLPFEMEPMTVDFTPGNGFSGPEVVEYEDGFLFMPINIDNDTTYFVNSEVCEPRFVCTKGDKAGAYEWQLSDYDESKVQNMLMSTLYGCYGDYMLAYITDANTKYGYYLIKNGKPLAAVNGDRDKQVKGFKCVLPNGRSVELNSTINREGKIICRLYGYQLEGIVDGITADSDPVLVVITLKQ